MSPFHSQQADYNSSSRAKTYIRAINRSACRKNTWPGISVLNVQIYALTTCELPCVSFIPCDKAFYAIICDQTTFLILVI